MTLVVDASICVKWFIDEDRAEQARRLADEPDLIAPTFVLLETYHVIWKRARRGDVTEAQRNHVLPLLLRAITYLEPDQNLARQAMSLAAVYNHAIYDCLYIALAAREQAPLVTADETQFATARKANIEVRLL